MLLTWQKVMVLAKGVAAVINLDSIHSILNEPQIVEFIGIYSMGILLFETAIIYISFFLIKKFGKGIQVPAAIRISTVVLGAVYLKYSFDFLVGINGGKNPFADPQGTMIFAVIFVETLLISALLWAIPLLFLFGKKKST
jgi:hypothetical protein